MKTLGTAGLLDYFDSLYVTGALAAVRCCVNLYSAELTKNRGEHKSIRFRKACLWLCAMRMSAMSKKYGWVFNEGHSQESHGGFSVTQFYLSQGHCFLWLFCCMV